MTPRRVGAAASRTRDMVLDAVEQLMLEKGYGGVTYRVVAAKAGVTASLVQYYFPTLDDVFIAAIRRRSAQNEERLIELLRTQADQPLRVLWEYSRDESTAALTTEFLALGNHRASIRNEIASVTEQVRTIQLEALRERRGSHGLGVEDPSPEALLFLVAGIPKLIRLEQGVGVSTTHAEIVEMIERCLDVLEPAHHDKDGVRT